MHNNSVQHWIFYYFHSTPFLGKYTVFSEHIITYEHVYTHTQGYIHIGLHMLKELKSHKCYMYVQIKITYTQYYVAHLSCPDMVVYLHKKQIKSKYNKT